MKEFATSAVLLKDGKTKTYEISYIDGSGREITVEAKGVNMVSALGTVLKQRKADKLASIPTWVWLCFYMVFATAFAITAIQTASPLMCILGLGLLIGVTKLLTDTYFKFVK